MDHLAVLAHIAVFEMRLGLAGHDFTGGLEGPLAVGGQDQVDHRGADQLVRRITEDALAGGTDKNKTSFDINGTHRIKQQVDIAGQRCDSLRFHQKEIARKIKRQYRSMENSGSLPP